MVPDSTQARSDAVTYTNNSNQKVTTPVCVASTYWRMGNQLGHQLVRARIGKLLAELHGRARYPARLIGGFAIVPNAADFDAFKEGDTVTVTTIDPTVEKIDVDTWIGVNWALVPSWNWLRLAAGTSFIEPTRRFYLGASALHVVSHLPWIKKVLGTWDLLAEEGGMDLQMGVRFNRREVGVMEDGSIKQRNRVKLAFFISGTLDARLGLYAISGLIR